MSLGLALNGAVSGLRTNQEALSIITQNITNANSANYTRQIIQQSAEVLDGVGVGSRIEEAARAIDKFLINAARREQSVVGRTAAVADILNRVQFFYGQPGSGNDLRTYADNFFQALGDLATNPEQLYTRTAALQSATTLSSQISNLATKLEEARFDADQEIKQTVDEVNLLLDNIFNNNRAIADAAKLGRSKNGLLDERDRLLNELQSLVELNITLKDSGQVEIFTNNADVLTTTRFHFEYNPAGNINDFVNNNPVNAISVVALDANGNPTTQKVEIVSAGVPDGSVTTNIPGGKLIGLMQVRDVDLPRRLAQLDEFAAKLRDNFNQIHNKGTGFPPPTSYTGTNLVDSSELRLWTGSFRLAALQTDGRPYPSPYPSQIGMNPLKLNLGQLDVGAGAGVVDTQTIVDEINRFYTPTDRVNLGGIADVKLASDVDAIAADGTFTFDLDIDNASDQPVAFRVLSLSSPDAGIAFPGGIPANLAALQNIPAGERLRTLPDSITADFAAAVGGGPHTIRVEIEVDGVASTIEYTVPENVTGIRNDRYSATGVFAGTAAIETPTTLLPVLVAEIVDANGNALAAGSEGYLRIRSGTSANAAFSIDELDSTDQGTIISPTTTATTRGFSFFYELNNFFASNSNDLKNSAINFDIRPDILNNAGLFSTGKIELSAALGTGVQEYTYEMGASSDQIVNALASLQFTRVSFDAAGSLPGANLTLGGYMSEVIGFSVSQTNNADNDLEKALLISDGLNDKVNAIGGVNVDEELANAVLFQNSFQATARMITTIAEMFEVLLESVG